MFLVYLIGCHCFVLHDLAFRGTNYSAKTSHTIREGQPSRSHLYVGDEVVLVWDLKMAFINTFVSKLIGTLSNLGSQEGLLPQEVWLVT